jgi:pentatricopeptide repeat domain-containing protein 1
VITYNASISACEKGEQWAAALGLLRQVHQQRIEPDVVTYNASILASCKSYEWAFSLALLHQMQGLGMELDQQGYASVVSACESRRGGPVGDIVDAILSGSRVCLASRPAIGHAV